MIKPLISLLVLLSPCCLLAGGLSDAFGYSGTTSLEGGPEFAFKDISTTGAVVPITTGTADDGAATVTLGAPFPFYGQFYTELRMSTNGYLSTEPTEAGYDATNDASLPTTPDIGGGARIYPLHDDLDATGGALHYQYFSEGIASPMFVGGFPFRPRIGVSVFQWTDVVFFGDTSLFSFSFQALLFDDGSLYFSYPSGNTQAGFSSTTGIQNTAATIGLFVAGDTIGSIPGDFAVSITPPHTVVTNTGDSGPGSLRQAIADSPNPGLITFDPTVFSGEGNRTIFLTSGRLDIPNKALAIEGNDVCGVNLDAGGNSRVIRSFSSNSLVLDSLNITGGLESTESGGGGIAISSISRVTIINSAIYECDAAEGTGGGISNSGDCRLENCTLFGNTADQGGGISNQGGTLILRSCTISKNIATGVSTISASGGIQNFGTTKISDSVIAGNSATFRPELSENILSEGGNFIRDNSAASTSFPTSSPLGTANINGDYVGDSANPLEPLFVGDSGGDGQALINNGGPTLTLMPLPGSPLIDKISTALIISDQRGIFPIGNRDIGAVETTWGSGVSAGTPAEFDLTTPGDPVAIFPTDSVLPFGNIPAFTIDNINSGGLVHDDTINSGLTVTPRLGGSQLTGISLTSANFGQPTEDPSCFILLGSDNGSCFTPIASAELPSFGGGYITQRFQFSPAAAAFRHYRVLFPANSGSSDYTSIEEIALHGTLLNTTTPRILDFKTAPNSGNPSLNDITLTFTSEQGVNYGIAASSPGLDNFNTINGTTPTAGEYTTTVISTFTAADSAFFRVFDLPLSAE